MFIFVVKEQQSIQSEYQCKTGEFIKKNWPIALVIAGSAGAIGAAVWLTARYLREKEKRNDLDDQALRLIESEVEVTSDPTVVLLETGTYLGQITGHEANQAALELAMISDDPEAKEAFSILGKVNMIDSNLRTK